MKDSNESKSVKWTVIRKYNDKFSCEDAVRKLIMIHKDMEEAVDAE